MNKFRTEIKWGIIFVISTIIWVTAEKALGYHDEHIADHPTFSMFFMAVAISIFIIALRDKRIKDFGGKMNYKQGFMTGLIISVVVTVLTPLSQYIVQLISPEYFNNAIEYAVENGKSTREEAEAYFNLKNYIVQSAIAAFVLGLITTAIVAIFTTKS